MKNLKIAEYPLHHWIDTFGPSRDFISLFQIAPIDIYQLMILGRLEIHIALSNPPNIDVRILPQGIVLPSLVYPYF